MKWLISLLLLVSTQAIADNERLLANSFLTLDWLQTRYIADNPDAFHEENQLLGKHPTTAEVNRHFISTLLVVNLLGEYLVPGLYKKNWYITIGALEASQVERNITIGMGLKF